MNIDLSPSVNFWEIGVWLLPISAIIMVALLILGLRFSLAAKKFKKNKLKFETDIAASKKRRDSRHWSAYKAKVIYEQIKLIEEKRDKEAAKERGLESYSTFMFSFIIIIPIVILITSALYIPSKQSQNDVLALQEAINSTYSVSVSKYETEQLMLKPAPKDSNFWYYRETLDSSSFDDDSYRWKTFDSYGIAEVLQNDGTIVEAQLVRVKKELKLVYTNKNIQPEALIEVTKR